jgi:hypothetical protein
MQRDTVGGRPAAYERRRLHGVGAQHPLHAGEGARGALVGGLVATPEPELAAAIGGDLLGDEPQPRDAGSGP